MRNTHFIIRQYAYKKVNSCRTVYALLQNRVTTEEEEQLGEGYGSKPSLKQRGLSWNGRISQLFVGKQL